jgi:nucleotide-binding universal stress UspA family protein
MKIDRVLVPVDGSVLAETAVYRAVDLVRETGATVYLVRAAEAHTLPGADPIEAQVAVVKVAEDYLQHVKARLAEGGFRNVETSVWYGSPTFAIVEAARRRRADLIVMTTHGRSGLGRLIMGSVAESVLRATETPILLLRAPGAPLEDAGGVARPVEAALAEGDR